MAFAPLAAWSAEELLAPTDQVVFVRSGDLWSVAGDGRGLRQLTHSPGREVRPMASPDGQAIAYEVYDSDRADYSLWTMSPDGGAVQVVVEGARYAAWSPDGGRLLFAMQRRSSFDIFMANRRGEELFRLLETPEQEYFPCWSPDGGEIAFVRQIRENNQARESIVVRSALGEERELVSLVGRSISSLSWAPSAKLLFSARERAGSGIDQLYLLAPDAEKPQPVTEGPETATQAAWTPLGGLVYVAARRGQPRLRLRGPDGEDQALAFSLDGDSEPTVLPGPSRRAPQIYVLGRRSYYLPAPRLVDGDVLIPAGDLATQLGLSMSVTDEKVHLTSPRLTVLVDAVAGNVTVNTAVGPQTSALVPPPATVAKVVMMPLGALAKVFGLTAEWQPDERVLRIGGAQAAKPAAP